MERCLISHIGPAKRNFSAKNLCIDLNLIFFSFFFFIPFFVFHVDECAFGDQLR